MTDPLYGEGLAARIAFWRKRRAALADFRRVMPYDHARFERRLRHAEALAREELARAADSEMERLRRFAVSLVGLTPGPGANEVTLAFADGRRLRAELTPDAQGQARLVLEMQRRGHLRQMRLAAYVATGGRRLVELGAESGGGVIILPCQSIMVVGSC